MIINNTYRVITINNTPNTSTENTSIENTSINIFVKSLASAFDNFSYITLYQNHPINVDILEYFCANINDFKNAAINPHTYENNFKAFFYINMGIHDRFTRKKIYNDNLFSLISVKKDPTDIEQNIRRVFTDPEYLADQSRDNGFYITDSQLDVKKLYNGSRELFVPNSSIVIKNNSPIIEKFTTSHSRIGKYIKAGVDNLRVAINNTNSELHKYLLSNLISFFETGDMNYYNLYKNKWANTPPDTNNHTCGGTHTDNNIFYLLGFNDYYRDIYGYKPSFSSMIYSIDLADQYNKKMQIIREQFPQYQNDIYYDMLDEINICVGAENTTNSQQISNGISNDYACKVLYVGGDNTGVIPIGLKIPTNTGTNNKCGLTHLIFYNLMIGVTPDTPKQFYNQQIYNNIIKYSGGDIFLFTVLHEFGHSSGKQMVSKSLNEYYAPLEEARADLFALYNILNYPRDLATTVIITYLTNGFFLQTIRAENKNSGAHFIGRYFVACEILVRAQNENLINIKVDNVENPTSVEIYTPDIYAIKKIIGDLFQEIYKIKISADRSAAQQFVDGGEKLLPEWRDLSKKLLTNKPFPVFVII